MGIVKQIFVRLKAKLESSKYLSGEILTPMIGGLIIGNSIVY